MNKLFFTLSLATLLLSACQRDDNFELPRLIVEDAQMSIIPGVLAERSDDKIILEFNRRVDENTLNLLSLTGTSDLFRVKNKKQDKPLEEVCGIHSGNNSQIIKISIDQLLFYPLNRTDALSCKSGNITDGIALFEEIYDISIFFPLFIL